LLRNFLGVLVTLACAPALAAVFAVTEPWLRPAGAGASSEMRMEVASSEDVTLVDARSALASRVALVAHGQRKSPPFALALPAKRTVSLQLSLMRLARPLALAQRVPLTLVVRHADGSLQEIEVDAEVRKRSVAADHHR
jgi:copper(I)-binding protein